MLCFPNRTGMHIYVNILVLHQTMKKLQILVVHEKGIANTRVNFSTGEYLQYSITIFSAKEENKQTNKKQRAYLKKTELKSHRNLIVMV